LAETDEGRNKTSKKDVDVREKEIRQAASEGSGLLRLIGERERVDEMCRDPGASILLGEIMLYAEGGELITYVMQHIPLISVFSHILSSQTERRLSMPLSRS
jgi:hypothetical protein